MDFINIPLLAVFRGRGSDHPEVTVEYQQSMRALFAYAPGTLVMLDAKMPLPLSDECGGGECMFRFYDHFGRPPSWLNPIPMIILEDGWLLNGVLYNDVYALGRVLFN